MWLPYVIFREAYLIGVRDLVSALSDSSTFMRYRGEGEKAIPDMPGF
jgi:hypothetical protein